MPFLCFIYLIVIAITVRLTIVYYLSSGIAIEYSQCLELYMCLNNILS